MNLFVDDVREAPRGWILARTVTEAIALLANFKFEAVSLDHDIAFMDETGKFTGKCSPENYSAVAHYIVQMPEEDRPHTVYVHTANPAGATSIASILRGRVKEIIRDTTYAHEWLEIDGTRTKHIELTGMP